MECDPPKDAKYTTTTFNHRQLNYYKEKRYDALPFKKAQPVVATETKTRNSYSKMQKAMAVTLLSSGNKPKEEVARIFGISSKACYPWAKVKAKSAFQPELDIAGSWDRSSTPGDEGDRDLEAIFEINLAMLSDKELLKLWKHHEPKEVLVHPLFPLMQAEEEKGRCGRRNC